MPITKSAIKRMRSDAKKRERNQAVLSRLKTLFKKYTKMIKENDTANASEFAKKLMGEYDKAASKGIIPKGRADRKKGRIQAALNKISK